MSLISTPEDLGREILNLYKLENIRPGEMLLEQRIRSWWIKKGKRVTDMTKGLQWLLEQGYLEQKKDLENAFFLTEAGFREI